MILLVIDMRHSIHIMNTCITQHKIAYFRSCSSSLRFSVSIVFLSDASVSSSVARFTSYSDIMVSNSLHRDILSYNCPSASETFNENAIATKANNATSPNTTKEPNTTTTFKLALRFFKLLLTDMAFYSFIIVQGHQSVQLFTRFIAFCFCFFQFFTHLPISFSEFGIVICLCCLLAMMTANIKKGSSENRNKQENEGMDVCGVGHTSTVLTRSASARISCNCS